MSFHLLLQTLAVSDGGELFINDVFLEEMEDEQYVPLQQSVWPCVFMLYPRGRQTALIQSYTWVYHFTIDLFTSGFGGGGRCNHISFLSLCSSVILRPRDWEKQNRLVGRKPDRPRYRKSCDCLEVKTIIDSTSMIIKHLMQIIHKVWLELVFGKFLFCISMPQKQVTSELSE